MLLKNNFKSCGAGSRIVAGMFLIWVGAGAGTTAGAEAGAGAGAKIVVLGGIETWTWSPPPRKRFLLRNKGVQSRSRSWS